jgi:hypothetical protein
MTFDQLDENSLAEWRYFVGYTDAEFYHNPIDSDQDYMRGFADGYAEIQMEGSYENFVS